MKNTLLAFGLSLSVLGSMAQAKEPNPVQQHNSNAIWFENWTGLSKTSMTIQAPDGVITDIYADSGTPVFQLTADTVLDGIYRYELTAATEETVKIVNAQNNGRGDAAKDSHSKSYQLNGHFTVSRGVIISPKDIKEE